MSLPPPSLRRLHVRQPLHPFHPKRKKEGIKEGTRSYIKDSWQTLHTPFLLISHCPERSRRATFYSWQPCAQIKLRGANIRKGENGLSVGNEQFLFQGLAEASQVSSQQTHLPGTSLCCSWWWAERVSVPFPNTSPGFSTLAPYLFADFLIICLSHQKPEPVRAEASPFWSCSEMPAPEYLWNEGRSQVQTLKLPHGQGHVHAGAPR